MCDKLVIFVFISLFAFANGARILAVIPTPSYSHQIAFQSLWRELSLNHQVTLVTTNPINDPSLTNLTEIDVGILYNSMKELHFYEKAMELKDDSFKLFECFNLLFADAYAKFFAHSEVRRLIDDSNEKFDLVMVEFLHSALFAFGHRFKAPVISVSSLEVMYFGHDCLGNPSHPILYTDVILPYVGKLSFFQRVLSSIFYVLVRWHTYSVLLPRADNYVKKYFGEDYPPVQELVCKMDMLFSNTNPIFNVVRPTVPAVVSIGGGMHMQKLKPLPKDLQEYLDSAKEGFLYFSLGSNVHSVLIPDDLRQTILETFAELPYKVLWKFENETLPGKPENVKIGKWLPQQDILRHPNIKLFITQGGIQSIEEGIFSHVPLIGMAFFGDQQNNVKRLAMKEIGLELDRNNLDKEIFKAAIFEVVNNPKYKENVRAMAELSLDQPMSGIEQAVWWTDYVIRHKGAQHLKGPAATLPLYQYYLLDVIGFLLAVLSTIVFTLYFGIRCIYRCITPVRNEVKKNQ